MVDQILYPHFIMYEVDMWRQIRSDHRHFNDARNRSLETDQTRPPSLNNVRNRYFETDQIKSYANYFGMGGAQPTQVYNREEIPADMLVVGVHERYRPSCGGVCYVETKSLDGEHF